MHLRMCIHAHPTHIHTRTHPHAFRCEVPGNRREVVGRTLAGVAGRATQLHSARRQATLRSGHLQIIEDINATNTAGPIILGLPSTRLQETGPAASAPHTRTHALHQGMCMSCASKTICDALAVAGVNRRPFGLFPALLQEACMCARHKRHACVQDTFLYIPILCAYDLRAEARALSPLFSMVINTKAQQAQYATLFRLRPSSPSS